LVATGLNGAAEAVPSCDIVDGQPQIPTTAAGFISCVISVEGLPGGGLLATLLARGGSDPGWGGAG
jgi:hypothetical protein